MTQLLDGVDADLFERRGPLWSDPLDPVQVVFHASHSSAPAFLLLSRVAPAADSTRLAVSAHPTRRGSRVRPPDHRWIDGGNGHNGLHFSSEVGSAAGILGPASDHVVMAAIGARRESQYSSRCHDNSSSTAGRPNGSPAWQTHRGPRLRTGRSALFGGWDAHRATGGRRVRSGVWQRCLAELTARVTEIGWLW